MAFRAARWQGDRVRTLVVNAGSSSLKLRVVEQVTEPGGPARCRGETARAPGAPGAAAETGDASGADGEVVAAEDLGPVGETVGADLERFLDRSPPVDAAGHRVVHGGAEFEHPLVVDAHADRALSRLEGLAPLHNPPALRAIHELRRRRPGLVQVACFDTSFHAGMPPNASTYAVPVSWRQEWGVRRFGFHGLSHAWASRRAARILGMPLETTSFVVAHIGAGASLAAVRGGRSVDTTMGFSPIDGLVMATRPGSVDPAIVLLAIRQGLEPDEVEDALERRSGLLALAGTPDLREVLAAGDRRDAHALLAYEVYLHRLRTSIGAMAVALGSLDALVFTGGAGEGSARLRNDVCAGLGLLGISAPRDVPVVGAGDQAGVVQAGVLPGGAVRGDVVQADRVLSAPGAHPAVVVVRAREELEIARSVFEVLSR